MPQFTVTYFYLATGMEGIPDTWSVQVEAENGADAIEQVILQRLPEDVMYGPNKAWSTREFMRGCMSAGPPDDSTRQWFRHTFKTRSVDDCRPVVFNPKYPWWCSGVAGDDSYATIVAWLPGFEETVEKYWPDAFDDSFTVHWKIEFSGRFPKPDYFVE